MYRVNVTGEVDNFEMVKSSTQFLLTLIPATKASSGMQHGPAPKNRLHLFT